MKQMAVMACFDGLDINDILRGVLWQQALTPKDIGIQVKPEYKMVSF